ncbi:hypothetical protein D9757_000129 [Collybiopsis confluens]|uniref:t-SNARE coiled-coil homology domain-containing protein n=1 Tax=Collybiopsis confluens TaxID=2823264 RepID=A0A8H5I2F5_9AGAR|nr:hypothetical protein D9757_000129 [Collybiopsis confluens]
MDTSPTALFDSYEQDYKQFIQTIREKLEGDENQETEQRKASLRRVEMDIDEADEMASHRCSSPSTQFVLIYPPRFPKWTLKFKAFPSLFELNTKFAFEPLKLISPAYSSDDPYGASSDRSRLLASTQLLEDGSKRLQDSHRLALETEEQGADILSNLRLQREQIDNSRNTLEIANDSISRASNTLSGMVRRMYQQRFVTAAIIAILVFLIVIVIWSKLS